MKTAERILLTSLEMFNQHGEANVTCVDIAMELDISPGNLYYHFKGKEIIVSALFDMYKQKMSRILLSPNKESLSIEDFFYFLLLILQSSHLFRFLYRNPADLIEKYPTISRGFQQLLREKEQSFCSLLNQFARHGDICANKQQISSMVDMIGLSFTQAPNYFLLKGTPLEDEAYITRCLQSIYFALAPYIQMDTHKFETIYQELMAHSEEG